MFPPLVRFCNEGSATYFRLGRGDGDGRDATRIFDGPHQTGLRQWRKHTYPENFASPRISTSLFWSCQKLQKPRNGKKNRYCIPSPVCAGVGWFREKSNSRC